MTWQNPWAWAGLLLLALPVLVHLLSRAPADVRRFPTLRFIEASRLPPRRRTRVRDVPLLLVRLAILAAAVAALAQPLLSTAGRAAAAPRVVRAIVLDTSRSMHRALATGSGTALDSARRVAIASAEEGARSVVVETADLAQAIPGALAWLAQQSGMHELVLVSDFQRGAVDSQALGAVPAQYGVRLVQIAASAPDPSFTVRGADGTVNVRVTPLADRTELSWQPATKGDSAVPATAIAGLTILGGETERDRATAAMNAAAGSLGYATTRANRFRTALADAETDNADTVRDVRLVYPDFAERAMLLARATLLSKPWMSELALALRDDELLQEVARDARIETTAAPPQQATGSNGNGNGESAQIVLARNADGSAVVFAAQDTTAGNDALMLFVNADAGSLTSAAVIAATARALEPTDAMWEREPFATSEAELRRWSRAALDTLNAVGTASASGSAVDGGDSDARWLWALALALLGVEAWMRRTSGEAVAEAA